MFYLQGKQLDVQRPYKTHETHTTLAGSTHITTEGVRTLYKHPSEVQRQQREMKHCRN